MSASSYQHIDKLPSPKRSRWALWAAIIGFSILIAWASVARINQVTRAQGQVISTSRTQEIQALDGGKITKLYVKEGDHVEAGQLLVVLEKERAQAAVDDSTNKVAALKITLARLQAEVYGKPLQFDPDLLKYQEFIQNQTNLYNRRRQAINDDISSLQKMLGLAQQELAMNEPLLKMGDVSKDDVIKLQRQVADIEAQIANKRNKYFQDAQADMTKAQEDLSTQQEQLRDRTQVLDHTELTSPLSGQVKNIKVNTIGGVVRPGDTVLEVLPDTDMVVEAKVSPADIAFVKPGQFANIKFDAYDYSIFGPLAGEVVYISPDTLTEETRNGPSSFYRVRIRVKPMDEQIKKAREIKVIPGMTGTVEIKALDRTVLSYLTKPISKTFSQSMGER